MVCFKIRDIILTFLGGILFCLLLLFPNFLDVRVLLEYNNPLYFEVLDYNNFRNVHITTEEDIMGVKAGNYILSGDITGDYNGLHVSEQADGSIVMHGYYDGEDTHLFMMDTNGHIIPDGDYEIDDGGASSDEIRFFVFSDGSTLAELPYTSQFHISNDSMHYIQYGFYVKHGAEAHNRVFLPIIRRIGDDLDYSPYLRYFNNDSDNNISLGFTEIDKLKKIKDRDWRVFFHTLSYSMNKRYSYLSMFFLDESGNLIGKGIQFDLRSNLVRYGKIDNFGRIVELDDQIFFSSRLKDIIEFIHINLDEM